MSYHTVAKIALSLGFIGLLDAVYLAVKHYTGGSVPCSLTGGCNTVLNSQFAVFGGVPLAAWGVAYYLMIIVLALFFLQTRSRGALGLIFGLTTAGVFSYSILIYVQAYILEAWCAYCLVSAALTAIIFVSLLFSRPSTS